MSSDGPPSSSAEFSRLSPCPGIVTHRSRGNDTTKPVSSRGLDVHDHHRVGPLPADVLGGAERLRLLLGLHEGAGVGADDQEVRRLALLLGHAAGRRGCAVVGISSTASSKNRLPVDTPIAVATEHEDERDREATNEVLERGARSHDERRWYRRPARSSSRSLGRRLSGSRGLFDGSPRSRAMSSRWISLVPSPISRIFASR